MNLEFATTDELITELLHRTTFVGMVIHSTNEHRDPDMIHHSFQISTNLSDANMTRLLGMVTSTVENGEHTEQA